MNALEEFVDWMFNGSPGRPLTPEEERAELIASATFVFGFPAFVFTVWLIGHILGVSV